MNTHPLTDARKRAGLSQQALADKIKMDRLSILRIEKWQTVPPLGTVSAIILALREEGEDISADAFIGPKADNSRVSA